MISIEKALISKKADIFSMPTFLLKPILFFLKKLFKEREINSFLSANSDLNDIEFIEKVLEYFNFSYSVLSHQKENIPAKGRVIIIANHPLGALDALALLKLIKEVREDVKIVANDILTRIEQLDSLILPIDNINSRDTKIALKQVVNALNDEEAVIIFPSGEVSRFTLFGVKDGDWKNGFLRFAKKTNSPILPIYIDAKNSSLFYITSMLYKPISSLLLAREMFKKQSKSISFKIGEIIPFENIADLKLPNKTLTYLLQKHLYKVSKNKKGIFETQKSISHPEDRAVIKRELTKGILLGDTNDNKKIYLCESTKSNPLVREIGRLREFTFRRVGEGSGKRRDTDKYDSYYKHIVLWDDDNLEIVGAYRIGICKDIMKLFGKKGLYTNSLFDLKDNFIPHLHNSIELGRSFVQPKYWNSRALDYLWQGIGAYIKNYPDTKYLFGAVSLSNSYPQIAKEMIVYFYSKYFNSNDSLVRSKTPFELSKSSKDEFDNIFIGDYRDDLKVLKEHLLQLNLTIPPLFKHYSELCEDDGVKFLDFNVDRDFNNCIDGFIIVNIEKIRDIKKKRYIK